jgi:hypothetical protein
VRGRKRPSQKPNDSKSLQNHDSQRAKPPAFERSDSAAREKRKMASPRQTDHSTLTLWPGRMPNNEVLAKRIRLRCHVWLVLRQTAVRSLLCAGHPLLAVQCSLWLLGSYSHLYSVINFIFCLSFSTARNLVHRTILGHAPSHRSQFSDLILILIGDRTVLDVH